MYVTRVLELLAGVDEKRAEARQYRQPTDRSMEILREFVAINAISTPENQ